MRTGSPKVEGQTDTVIQKHKLMHTYKNNIRVTNRQNPSIAQFKSEYEYLNIEGDRVIKLGFKWIIQQRIMHGRGIWCEQKKEVTSFVDQVGSFTGFV